MPATSECKPAEQAEGLPDHSSVAVALEDVECLPFQRLRAVGFLPRGHDLALPRTPPVEFLLDVFRRQRNPRRHAVDHHSDPAAVRFPEGVDAESVAER